MSASFCNTQHCICFGTFLCRPVPEAQHAFKSLLPRQWRSSSSQLRLFRCDIYVLPNKALGHKSALPKLVHGPRVFYGR